MSLEEHMMPGYFNSIAAISKQMDLLNGSFPQSSAIQAAINANKLFHEKFAWMDGINKQLASINSIQEITNKYQFYDSALRVDRITNASYKPIFRDWSSEYRFDRDLLNETIYEFETSFGEENNNVPTQEISDSKPEIKSLLYLKEATKVKAIIESVWLDNQYLYQMKPREFEIMSAELLKSQGYDVQLTKETRDGGYDVFAIGKAAGEIEFKMLVQCKRNREDRKIDVDVVRLLRDVVRQENANKGLIITTSFLTRDSIEEIKNTALLLDYRDKNHILDWVKNYMGIKIFNR